MKHPGAPPDLHNGKQQQAKKEHGMGRIGHRPYWVLNLSIVVRALHQLGAAVFVTAFLFTESFPLPPMYMNLVMVSGLVLVGTEWLRHRQMFREISGLTTLVKMVLIGAALHGLLPATPTIIFAFLLASVVAHAPKLIRHRLVF